MYYKELETLSNQIREGLHSGHMKETTHDFYRIGRILGRGAFGKVSLAMHRLSEQLVAIKALSKEHLKF
jgi:serine/threonine protein kinase